MHGNNGNERKYDDNTVSGRERIRADLVDPKRVDDFTERIKHEEERKKQNQSIGQGSSKNGK